jgi:hypothetical protein
MIFLQDKVKTENSICGTADTVIIVVLFVTGNCEKCFKTGHS